MHVVTRILPLLLWKASFCVSYSIVSRQLGAPIVSVYAHKDDTKLVDMTRFPLYASDRGQEEEAIEGIAGDSSGLEEVTLDGETRATLEGTQPSELMVMKDLLGINGFTYILAALIAFFFGMNTFLGPGWLGNSIGIQSTGSFTDMSPSLPETVDLSSSEFLIK